MDKVPRLRETAVPKPQAVQVAKPAGLLNVSNYPNLEADISDVIDGWVG